MTSLDRDKLHEQFLSYQLLTDTDIPESVNKKSGSDVNGYYRIDDLWGYLKDLMKPSTNIFEFDLLFKVAEIIKQFLTQMQVKRTSLINKNKTPSRDSLKFYH